MLNRYTCIIWHSQQGMGLTLSGSYAYVHETKFKVYIIDSLKLFKFHTSSVVISTMLFHIIYKLTDLSVMWYSLSFFLGVGHIAVKIGEVKAKKTPRGKYAE